MLAITKDITTQNLENWLEKSNDPILQIPTQVNKSGSWGIEASLIQLILTWARKNPAGTLRTFIQEDSQTDVQLSELSKRLHGIVALWMAAHIETAQGKEISWREAVGYARDLLNNMDQCDVTSPKGIQATIADGKTGGTFSMQFLALHPARIHFLQSLYSERNEYSLKGRSHFQMLVSAAARSTDHTRRWINSKIIGRLSSILYELFQNTNDHALVDMEGREYSKNARGFQIKEHRNWRAHSPLKDFKDSNNPRLSEYVSYCEKRFSKTREGLNFVELSVFDGGCGMASNLTGKHVDALTPEEEIEATKKCFFRGRTSKKNSGRGEGLYDTWKDLIRLKGFVRIRTGRVSLYQGFHDLKISTNPNTGIDEICDPDLVSWYAENDKLLVCAAGTTITIIIPQFDKDQE